MKNKFMTVLLVAIALFPFMAQADIVALQSTSLYLAGPLSCFDFNSTLKVGNKSYATRGLQFALIDEGLSISPNEYGVFGSDTFAAVKVFQQKYASDILTKDAVPTGVVDKMTRNKLNALYGCSSVAVKPKSGTKIYPAGCTPTTAFSATTGLACVNTKTGLPLKVSLAVASVALDSNGASATFCNQGTTDVPIFPVRLRLNGIIRDFNVLGAFKAGTCDTEVLPYSTWGLNYDTNTTFGLVSAIDPNSLYKTSQLTYPSTGTATLTIPAVAGAHLSIRGLFLKSNGLQTTVCNLGDADLPTFPVHIIVNGIGKDVDVAGAHMHGQCPVVTWTYDMFGLPALPAAGTLINATVNLDPNNIYKEQNELDNSATILGNL